MTACAACPLSFIWGMRDTAFGPAILERWTDAFPDASVTRIDDAGHWPHEERPDLVVAALEARSESRSRHFDV